MPTREPGAASEVIDQLIRENRFGEVLLYTFSIAFVAVGLFVIVVGAIRSEGLVALAGGIASALFWPAMHCTRQIRRENMAIRLLEVPLSKAATEKQAATAIRQAFTEIFVSIPKKPLVETERPK